VCSALTSSLHSVRIDSDGANLVSGRSKDPNHDAVMRIGSEAPKRRNRP
jgi:hypothetical protein